MTFKKTNTKTLIKGSLIFLKQKGKIDSSLKPLIDALTILQDGKVEKASEIAARSFDNGASIEDRKIAIDLISRVAIENKNHGHWYETLLLQAAEGGLSDCAYNVGNLITKRASSPEDHALANRYYTQAAKNATNPATKASALVNSCMPIRDGLIDGKPNWNRAVEIYEEAGNLNLAVGMYNAANVSCWLKDHGEYQYAARAVYWLNKLISMVDSGQSFVDLGGDDEVAGVYAKAKNLLAQLHAMDQVEHVNVELILDVSRTESCPQMAEYLRRQGYEHLLRKTAVEAKPAAWENWLSVLKILGWELHGQPLDLGLGEEMSDSRLLKFKLENGSSLSLAVVNLEEIETNGGVYRLANLAKNLQDEFGEPCLAISSKSLFISLSAQVGHNSYTVFVSCGKDGKSNLVPIWPGATADDVAKQVYADEPNFSEHNKDNGNTIAILANALGMGRNIDGENFPEAIYVNVGKFFNTPIFTVNEAINLGCQISPKELQKSLDDVKAYFKGIEERKKLYLGTTKSK